MRSKILRIGLVLLALPLLAVAVYFVPPVHERLSWRVDSFQAKIKYALNPPEQVVFVPREQQAQIESIVQATLQAMTPTVTSTVTPSPTVTPTVPGPTETPTSTPTLTPTPTPLPDTVKLEGITHIWQRYNNCGPATLAMALSYWGWEGGQNETAAVLKPVQEDKNVMPYEMQAYVEQHTSLRAIVRTGGDLELLKSLTAAGYPVVIERGLVVSGEGWLGHYQFVIGYEQKDERFITYDSYMGPGKDVRVAYEIMHNFWQDFNNIFLVIYPPEQEAQLFSILGERASETGSAQVALEQASLDILEMTGRDQYFAWHNRGTNLVTLQDYAGAATAYDEAFKIYAELGEKERPWRNIWYQTGPYFAYHYTGRYYDVIDLATKTLQWLSNEPVLEESYVWRARSKIALGDIDGAVTDLKTSLKYHPGFPPSLQELQNLGVSAED